MRIAGLLLALACAPWAAAQSIPGVGPTGGVREVVTGRQFTEGPAWDGRGCLYFTDIPRSQILRLAADGKVEVFTDQSRHSNGLMFTPQGRLLACEMDGQLVEWDVASKTRRVLAAEYQGARFNACNDLVIDTAGGVYFTDPHYRAPDPLPQGTRAVYYRSPAGGVTRIDQDLPAPNGILLSPDERTLYVLPTDSRTMLAYEVASPGVVGPARDFCRTEGRGGSDGAAMDTTGKLYLTTRRGVQVFSPGGKHLGTIEIPQQPANCTFGGPNRQTLYVTAQSSVYAVPMQAVGHVYGG